MPAENSVGLPLPSVYAFMPLLKLFQDHRSGALIMIGPGHHLPIPEFPATAILSFYAQFGSGHGSYLPQLELRDLEGQPVWTWTAPGPFHFGDPVFPHEVNFFDLPLLVPKQGRYAVALKLNGTDVAERSMWFGPKEAFLP